MDKNTLISSFGKWVSPINLRNLNEQVEELKLDNYTKKLSTKSYIKLLLFAQLNETESLRAISDALLDDDLQRELGFESISASQLSRKNNEMDPSILSNLFLDLVGKIRFFHSQNKTKVAHKIIDSSTLPLNLTNYKWAKFRKTKAGAKLHMRLVFMEDHSIYPDKAVITAKNTIGIN